MGRRKFLQNLLREGSENNVNFRELLGFLVSIGFQIRVRGDHHILTKPNIEEIINLQPMGHRAKAYQVRQVRSILLKYHLGEQ